MSTVYVETSIPSFYHETRTAPRMVAWREATREWWEREPQRYDLFTSRFVREELSRALPKKAQAALDLLTAVRVLDEPPEAAEVVGYYLEQRLMPLEAGGEAFHLALVSLHTMDFLLTWNCQHLANANKIRHISVLNGRLGLHVPIITTPLTLLPETY
jgi:hypothetical protein